MKKMKNRPFFERGLTGLIMIVNIFKKLNFVGSIQFDHSVLALLFGEFIGKPNCVYW